MEPEPEVAAFETSEEMLWRVLGKQKKHGHRFWGLQSVQVFQHQADAVLSQASPVSGTLYTVLTATRNVRLISIQVVVTWTVQPSPLEVVITIDGVVIDAAFVNPVSGTNYDVQNSGSVTIDFLLGGAVAQYRAFLLEGRSVRVQARTTGGTVSNLTCRVCWARIP